MPIYNSRDIIPFVNQLEVRINEMNTNVTEWNREKHRLITAADRVAGNTSMATSALIRADEAMSEIGTATFKSTAARGKRLEDTLNQLRKEMFDIASQVEGGGGGSLTEGIFYDELNNAISSVDPTINDGLKLDYRLREIMNASKAGVEISQKNMIVPYKFEVEEPQKTHVIIPDEGVVFVEGEVTVLDEDSSPFLDEIGNIIQGTIQEDGSVTLTNIPPRGYTLYFPVRMAFKDVPEDFLYLLMKQMIEKNSRIMEVVLTFENEIENILKDIEYMKGVRWTPDLSIMKNHQDIIKEGITPKGLQVEVKNGMANVTFSYNDHPNLSHFILEKWNEEEKRFVPYDGDNGIIQK